MTSVVLESRQAPPPLDLPAATGHRRVVDLAGAATCAAVVVAAVLLTHPVADIAFNDDWSYAFTAKRLAETGRLAFNGWATACLGLQAYWGALWIKAFGFSFTVLRLSTLPLAAGCGVACYALGRLCGLRPAAAVFACFTLVCSPIFLSQAASFMTDVPGLLFILTCLCALIAAMRADTARSAVRWMIVAAVVAIVGGTVRQTAWVAPLALLPYLAWVRRWDRAVVVTAAVLWAAVLAAAVVTIAWFLRQPYSVPDAPAGGFTVLLHRPDRWRPFAWNLVGMLLTLALLLLPVVLATLPTWRRKDWAVAAGAFAVLVALPALLGAPLSAPWLRLPGNALTPWGILGDAILGPGRPPILPWVAWKLLTPPALLAAALLVAGAWRGLRSLWRDRWWISRAAGDAGDDDVIAALALFTAVYLALLLPRCAVLNGVFDRYLLVPLPCVAIVLLLAWQRRSATAARIPLAAWVAVAALGLFSVLSTQELFALARARAAAAGQLVAAGVPRSEIDAGFEYNAWTELEISGYYHDSRIVNPPGAVDPAHPGPTPHVRPRYQVTFAPRGRATAAAPAPFPPVKYTTYLPPRHRELVIRRVEPG